VALDIETYGRRKGHALDPFQGDIRLLTLAIPGREPWLLDLRALGYDLGPLKLALQGLEVIGHNLRFDALWLAVKCGLRLANVFCTLTASKLLTNGSNQKNDLGECLRRHLGVDLPKGQAKSDWGQPVLSPDQLAYAGNDVLHLHTLKTKLEEAIGLAGLGEVARLEMSLLPVVVATEARGFGMDKEKLQALYQRAKAQTEAIRKELQQRASSPDFNPNSQPQLLQEFAVQGITLSNTTKETLSQCPHPLAAQILDYRDAKKQAEQAESLLEAISADGRIHARFNPLGAETGRFSSSEPNLQNVGRGKALRSCFVAAPGQALVIADYSQIELRVAAVIAGEERMLRAYQKGVDLHKQTASLVLEKPLDQVSKEDRQLAKAVNFGLIYGQSAEGLMGYAKTGYGVDLTEQEARTFRNRFFDVYPGFKQWHERNWRKAKNLVREVRTKTGRRRLLPRESEMGWQRFTGLVNTAVQRGCADGLKYAMVAVSHQLPQGAGIVSAVHDELIVEVPEALAEQTKALIQQAMIDAMARLFPEVPIEVDAKIASTWAEK
jgi:DNA polymerase-1